MHWMMIRCHLSQHHCRKQPARVSRVGWGGGQEISIYLQVTHNKDVKRRTLAKGDGVLKGVMEGESDGVMATQLTRVATPPLPGAPARPPPVTDAVPTSVAGYAAFM